MTGIPSFVIPAPAGLQDNTLRARRSWTPAFAGVTDVFDHHRDAIASGSCEDCGAPIGRDPSRDKGSLAAPRCGDILGPGAALTAGVAPPEMGEADWTRHVPGRAAGERRTPEAGPLPRRRCPGWHHPKGLGPILSAGTSGAASQVPRYRRSAARVLMDEGWSECKRVLECGDWKRVAPPSLACGGRSPAATRR
jgi:hypothetical protein